MKKFILTAAVGLAFITGSAHAQTTLAQWTFETTVPASAGPLAPEVVASGVTGALATSNTGGTFSNPIGNGTAESWSSTGWNVGEYFQFQITFDASGYDNITVSWEQLGSSTGPRDFSFSYSFDGGAFVDAQNYTVTGGTWSSSTYNSGYSQSYDIDIRSVTGTSMLAIRLTDVSTTSIGGGTVGGTGTGRVDTFTISATAIPEPSTYAAIFGGAALVGAVVYRRRATAASAAA